jgi:hypothetical protein
MLDHLYQYTLDAGAKMCVEASQDAEWFAEKKPGALAAGTAQPAAERGGRKQQEWMTVGNWLSLDTSRWMPECELKTCSYYHHQGSKAVGSHFTIINRCGVHWQMTIRYFFAKME